MNCDKSDSPTFLTTHRFGRLIRIGWRFAMRCRRLLFLGRSRTIVCADLALRPTLRLLRGRSILGGSGRIVRIGPAFLLLALVVTHLLGGRGLLDEVLVFHGGRGAVRGGGVLLGKLWLLLTSTTTPIGCWSVPGSWLIINYQNLVNVIHYYSGFSSPS